MDLTIIIVNWNGGDLLLRCLQTIRESKTSFQVKVIVVDNDSADGSRDAAIKAFPEFHVFNSGSNLGFGRANNAARHLVQTPLVLFLNPDTELQPDSLEKAVQCLVNLPDVGALGCKMLYPDGTVQDVGIQWLPTPITVLAEMLFVTRVNRRRLKGWFPVVDPNKSSYCRKIYGGFVLARREILDKAGWFDDRYFMYAEDVDLSHSITVLGWKLYYCADSVITHVCGGTSEKAPSGFSILMKHESICKYMAKYHGILGSLGYRLVIIFGSSIRYLGVLLARPLSFGKSQQAKLRQQGALRKHQTALLWSLGLRKAAVPTLR